VRSWQAAGRAVHLERLISETQGPTYVVTTFASDADELSALALADAADPTYRAHQRAIGPFLMGPKRTTLAERLTGAGPDPYARFPPVAQLAYFRPASGQFREVARQLCEYANGAPAVARGGGLWRGIGGADGSWFTIESRYASLFDLEQE